MPQPTLMRRQPALFFSAAPQQAPPGASKKDVLRGRELLPRLGELGEGNWGVPRAAGGGVGPSLPGRWVRVLSSSPQMCFCRAFCFLWIAGSSKPGLEKPGGAGGAPCLEQGDGAG